MVSKLCDWYVSSLSFFLTSRGLWFYKHFFLILSFFEAGAGGGLVASIATCPLDVIKTKLQAQRAIQGQQAYLGVFGVYCVHFCFSTFQYKFICCFSWKYDLGTMKSILRENGLRGFYRGLGPTMLGYLPTWAIYFAVYDGIKTVFGDPPDGSLHSKRLYPAAQVKGYQPVIREHPWSLHILSAMTAGATSTICTNPLWVIKTRFMVRCSFDDIRTFLPTLICAVIRRKHGMKFAIDIPWMLR